MVIVDSSVWIDYLNRNLTPQTRWLKANRGAERIGLTTLVLAEVLQGIRYDSKFRAAEQFFRTLAIHEPLSLTVAIQAASNYRRLRARGITIRNTVDCLIATFCIENKIKLLHNRRDFEPFEQHLGLKVVHP